MCYNKTMPRPLRIEAAGMWYHIMNRGIIRKNIFVCDDDYQKFLEELADSCEKYNVEIHSYVLMPNHFHFFLKTNEANLSRFMHRQLTSYTNWFNQKYERVGHLFQGRYKSIVIDNNNYGTEITRYIHLNPIRTRENLKLNLREKRKYLEKYKWSSYPEIIGLKSPSPFLYIDETLEKFGFNRKEQIKEYLQFIDEGIKKDLESPLKNAVAQSVLGSKLFVREILKKLKTEQKYDAETNKLRKQSSLPIEKILEIVCQEYNINKKVIVKQCKDRYGIEARMVAFYLAAKYCVGMMTLNQIAKSMGCQSGWSVTLAVKRVEELKKQDKVLIKKLKRLEKFITVYYGVRKLVVN